MNVDLLHSDIMRSAFLGYKSSQIHYNYYGTGDNILLCFHGYGEDATSFECLCSSLPASYSIFAIDLPYHGRTEWKEIEEPDVYDVAEIIANIRSKHFPRTKRMTLLGFSLGGRIALSFFQQQPATIIKIILLAPDGLKVNFWYWIATQTPAGNSLFAFTMKSPSWFFFLLRIGNRLRLINPSLYKFTNRYIKDAEGRKQLYNRWTSLRHFKPDLQKIKKKVKQHNTPVSLIYGEFDRIIVPQRAGKFSKGIENNCTITILPCGHQVLQVKNSPVIISLLEK